MARRSNTWIFNISPENWETCAEGPTDDSIHPEDHIGQPVLGIRPGTPAKAGDLEQGDLVLARHKDRGIAGIWTVQEVAKVDQDQQQSLWPDAEYEYVIYCRPLHRELAEPYEEDWASFAEDLDRNVASVTGTIQGAVVNLPPELKDRYLINLLLISNLSIEVLTRLEHELEEIAQAYPTFWRQVLTKRILARKFLADPSRERLLDLANGPHFWAAWGMDAPSWVERVLSETTPEELATGIKRIIQEGEAGELREYDHIAWATGTEILRAIEPDKFAILNTRSKTSMEELGYNPPDKNSATQAQYEQFVSDVLAAKEDFNLAQMIEDQTDEEIPWWATDFEIVDCALRLISDNELTIGTGSEVGYFILRTGSDEWSDTPSEEYHFKEGIPGSRQLREANRPRVVFSEDAEFYAKAVIGEVRSEERDGETHYFAQIEDYAEIDPIQISEVRNDLEQSMGVQYGIIKISETDYRTIIEGGRTRYFWINSSDPEWPGNGDSKFYSAQTSSGNSRRMKSAFERARAGDRVVVYDIAPTQRITGIARVEAGLEERMKDDHSDPTEGIPIQGLRSIDGPSWDEITEHPDLKESTPVTSGNHMVFGELSESEYQAILDLAEEKSEQDVEKLHERLRLPRITAPRPDSLFFDDDDELFRQIEGTLNSGKHILFTGPPGTGKTKLAKEIAEHCTNQYPAHVDDYRFTTATSAWTTFDTIGGYVPRQQKGGDELVFQPRIFLNCFREQDIRNDWLVIDEINRSDIDKAFGQLFSVLSGDTVELPYERESPVEIVALEEDSPHHELRTIVENRDKFPVTPSWRLLATMNTYDKASLYEMSYAFMRRFNFIHVGVPELRNGDGEVRTNLLNPDIDGENYASKWIDDAPELKQPLRETHGELAVLWERINRSRSIGPSIIRDIVGYIAVNDSDASTKDLLTDSVIALVYPQLEGMRPKDQKQLITSLSAEDVPTQGGNVTVELDGERLRRKAEDFHNIEFEDDE